MTLDVLKQSSRWLNRFEKNFYSQTGEDGVIAKALSLLPHRDRWCVEFGAWDGKHLSNTYNLVENDQYSVILIEGDKKKHQELCREYPFQDRGIFVNKFVGWTATDGLDSILKDYPIPNDFDFLSIDIDGNDYHVWKAIEAYKPKLILIEFNPTSSNRFEYVQPADPNRNQSSSPLPIVKLGRKKGYELVSVIGPNLLFVEGKYYDIFNIPDNSLAVMRDEDELTSVFLGFDGSLIIDGPADLRWHGGKLKIPQPFPTYLRQYPPTYSRLQWKLFKLFQRLKRR